MSKFYLNSREQEASSASHEHEHEIHRGDCYFIPKNYIYLGEYSDSKDAILVARIWTNENHLNWYIDGCAYCCPEINSDDK